MSDSKLVLAKAPGIVRLDLGAGQNPKDGYEAVDLHAPNVAHRVDLFRFPWPFEDNSVDELHASHLIEHIPNRDIEERDIIPPPNLEGTIQFAHAGGDASATMLNWNRIRDEFIGKDMLFAFFDECYRILKHDGVLTLVWPALRSNRAFQDPTHRRYIPQETLMYLDPAWRKVNKLDHYRVNCHFVGNGTCSVMTEETAFTPEVQQRRQNNFWNTILDFYATMKAVKTPQ